MAAYNDLGSVSLYRSTIVSTPESGGSIPAVLLSLSAAAIADMNAPLGGADQHFVVGGSSPTTSLGKHLWGAHSLVPAADLLVVTARRRPRAVRPTN